VRPTSNDAGQIGKLLDAGAMGVICPMINSAADAKRLVAAARYAPLGERSFGPVRPNLIHGAANWRAVGDAVLVLAMIETRAAYENLDDILAVEGVDGVYVGPSDLGLSMIGEPVAEPMDTRVVAAIADIRKRSQAAGKLAAIHNLSVERTAEMVGHGWDLVTCGSDFRKILLGAAADVKSLRELPRCAPVQKVGAA
jgi:4-hydroxy-2-oxoheptanedioate aldolase